MVAPLEGAGLEDGALLPRAHFRLEILATRFAPPAAHDRAHTTAAVAVVVVVAEHEKSIIDGSLSKLI